MGKHDFSLSRKRTLQHLADARIENHMLHGPTTDKYWDAPVRVLSINMESYGYEDCGHWEVNLSCLLDWMYDRGNTGTRTVRYTLAIARTLKDSFATGSAPTPEDLRRAFADAVRLEDVAEQIAYYNIRPTSNPEKREDFSNIVASASHGTAQFVRAEMAALEPHVVLISGHAGLAAFNTMWGVDPHLRFLEGRRHSETTFLQSVRHPSRPDYGEWAEIIGNVVRELKSSIHPETRPDLPNSLET